MRKNLQTVIVILIVIAGVFALKTAFFATFSILFDREARGAAIALSLVLFFSLVFAAWVANWERKYLMPLLLMAAFGVVVSWKNVLLGATYFQFWFLHLFTVGGNRSEEGVGWLAIIMGPMIGIVILAIVVVLTVVAIFMEKRR